MLKNQLSRLANICKKPAFILALIVSGFFLREVFIATLLPMFSGQDEPAHYITIQFLTEPKKKTWQIKEVDVNGIDIAKMSNLHASEEIENTIALAELATAKNKHSFIEGYYGKNERQIISNNWKKYIEIYPPSTVGGTKLYHWLSSLIEKLFADQNILSRFFLIRIFSVFLGALSVLLSYFIFKNMGFSEKVSLIMTGIISLQPKLMTYVTNINYDSLLILVFTAFIFGGVLFLKNGPDWKNLAILGASFVIGLFAKATAIVLVGPLFALGAFYLYQKSKDGTIRWNHIAFIFIFIITISGLFSLSYNLSTITPTGAEEFSFVRFLSKASEKIPATSKSYWGNLDWTRNDYSENFIQIIWALEALGAVGIIFFLLAKKIPPFLPQKKYILFLLLMLFSLQFGIAWSDWRITASGAESLFAAPGRYFLPNLAAHIALMFAGLGMLLRKEKYLDCALLFSLVLMFAFNFYVIFNIIIPRFYF